MTAVIDTDSPAGMVAVIEANPIQYWRTCSPRLPGVERYDEPDMTRFVTSIPFAPFNQVIRTQIASKDIDARIDETLALCEERGVPLLWSVTSATEPADIGRRLEAHGLTNNGAMTGMAIDLEDLPHEATAPEGFAVEQVDDASGLEAWRRAYGSGFEMPEFASGAFRALYTVLGYTGKAPFRHYVGWLDGEPVASSTLFLGTGVADIWHVGTVPTARRRGIGAAMTLTPLLDARSMGCRFGTVYSAASATGLNIYRELGFKEYCGTTQYLWEGRP